MRKKHGPFGLKSELKILESGVRDVFTPHTPIQSSDLFFGRQKEVQKIISQINTPGQHSLLYGSRGVGKSSLANISTQVLISRIIPGQLFTKRCDSSDTFLSIISAPLNSLGIDHEQKTTTKSKKQGGKAGVNIGLASSDIDTHTTTQKTSVHSRISPSSAADILKNFTGLLYIDEADRIKTKEMNKLSQLIKLLSDNGSDFKILIVGIAETADELSLAHPSIERCLKETKLRTMSRSELESIIVGGSKKIGIEFSDDVIKEIARLSSGFAHFTHLLALKCCENAIANNTKFVSVNDLQTAIDDSVVEAEASLKRVYDNAARSHGTNMYKNILFASSLLGSNEFSASDLRSKISSVTGEKITQGSMNNYLKRLVSNDGKKILLRKAKGVYKFPDPRMPSYIKLANYDKLPSRF